MRGERTWAVAVRTPEGDIEIETHEAPTWARALGEGPARAAASWRSPSRMALGFKALTWSANRQIPEEEQISSKAMGWTIGVALALLHRHLHPAPGARRQRRSATSSGSTASGSTSPRARSRLGIFLGYLALDRARSRTSSACSSTTAPSTRRSPRTRTTSRLTAESAQRFATAARALRHQLPAHGDGDHHLRVLVRRPAGAGRS